MINQAELLRTARSYIGIKEVRGPETNPTIQGWIYRFARNIKLKWVARKGDSIAWCAVFVSKVLAECGYTPTYHALAMSYATWGRMSKPVPGAIVVIRKRKGGKNDKATGSRTGNHVGFLEGVGRHYYKITGGNQRDSVRTSYFSKKMYELVAVRKPDHDPRK